MGHGILPQHWIREQESQTRCFRLDPKYFFSFANESAKIKNKVGPLLNDQGEMKNDPESMTEILRKQYDSVFIEDDEDEEEEEDIEKEDTTEITMEDVIFSKDDLDQA